MRKRLNELSRIIFTIAALLLWIPTFVYAAPEGEVRKIYTNNDFHCQMTLPPGWTDTSMTNKEVISLYKSIPVLDDNGKKMAAILQIRQRFINSTFQTLGELPDDKVETIKDNFIKYSWDNIRVKTGISVEGNVRGIGHHKVIWIIESGKFRVINATLVEKGVMWDFRVAIPKDYFETMTSELEQLINSLTML